MRKARATLAKQENTWRGALSSESLGNCIFGYRGERATGTLGRPSRLLENEGKADSSHKRRPASYRSVTGLYRGTSAFMIAQAET